MTTTMTLQEADIREAIRFWLLFKGWQASAITFDRSVDDGVGSADHRFYYQAAVIVRPAVTSGAIPMDEATKRALATDVKAI